MLNITKGRQVRASKTLIYGLPGAGKSTLASTMPAPLFLDTERGLAYLDVDSVAINSAEELMSVLVEIGRLQKGNECPYKTLVIDSVDWLINFFKRQVTGSGSGRTVADMMQSAALTLNKSQGGYGNGKQVLENYIRDMFIPFLDRLNQLQLHIVMVAHADQKNLLNADGTNTLQMAPKMDLSSMNALVEWVDNIFYLKRENSGERSLQVAPSDEVVAKNRVGITEEEQIVDANFSLADLLMRDNKTNKTNNKGDK